VSIRVHTIAKELGLTSKDLIERLHKLKVDVKGHMSTLDKETAEIVRHEIEDQLKGKSKPAKEKVEKKAAKEKPAKEKPKEKTEKAKPPKGKPPKKKAVEEKPVKEEKEIAAEKEQPAVPEKKLESLEVDIPVTVKDLSVKLSKKPSELISKLISKGVFANINQNLHEEIVKEVAAEYGYEIVKPPSMEEELLKELKKGRPMWPRRRRAGSLSI